MRDVIIITEDTTLEDFRKIKMDDLIREGDTQEKVIDNHILYNGDDKAYEVIITLQSSAKVYRSFDSELLPDKY